MTIAEVLTEEMRQRIVAAWGKEPFNGYGSSGDRSDTGERDRHAGLHVFEDLVQIEVVDDEYLPARRGSKAAACLSPTCSTEPSR